ncbi:hypothetical protein A3862_15880 [Methylobacterium sp. XJLW]|uniref:hypothetical protein n=1 Tax=Methylobacterium sp. XJLW TaxID=739141 RepID=UPI000DAAEA2B|nr:hypothetical protein [Methylobacterium sp. XJLW]AWV16797.1 hypothetical protein A3862_15880 [Methylobacterium sp. XJLW]
MSASVEIFDVLRLQAYAFVGRVHRKTGAPVTEEAMASFLGEAVKRYVAGGGVGELTDAVIEDTCRSITRFCVAMPVRVQSAARKRLFDAMSPRGKAWAKADLQRQARATKGRKAHRSLRVDRTRLRSYVEREAALFCAVPGQACTDEERIAVVDAVTQFSGNMRPGRPAAVRPNRTAEGMQETDFQIGQVLGYEKAMAEYEGREPRRLSIDVIHSRLQTEWVVLDGGRTSKGLPGVTRASVRGAVERSLGQPRRAAALDRLPPTARDLAGALEAELPRNRISVVETDAVARKLWAPARTPEGRRQHVCRLRVATAAIEDAGIGLHLAVVGSHVVVGRGRKLPEGDALQALVDGAVNPVRGRRRVTVLSRGLVPSRQGLWGTEEGDIAKSVCRVAASQGGHDDVYVTLSAAGQGGAADDFSAVWDGAGEPVQHDSLVLADAVEKAAQSYAYGKLSPQASSGVELVRTVVTKARDAGLDQAWAAYVAKGAIADRLLRSTNGARERVRRIGAALSRATCPEAWEAAILLDAYSVRPGRRHSHPVVTMPRAPKPVAAPAPAPQAEFYPTHVKDASLSKDMIDEIKAHWSVNAVRPAMQAMRAIYLGYDIEDAKQFDLDELAVPATVDEVAEGLRRVLRWWKTPELAMVASLDEELRGALRQAIVNAGVALREHGSLAFRYAAGVVLVIAAYAGSVDGARSLPRRLTEADERFRWGITRMADAAA